MPLKYHRQLVTMRSAIRLMDSSPIAECFRVDLDQPSVSPSFPCVALRLLRDYDVSIPTTHSLEL
ncbi:hypothetical protein, partial [Klebsiella pneumoniae]|uniref:hypothetical protein n=1 Tax=Klebsiella pneumoniae TaxID=573 RepID=UPI003EBFF8E4